MTKAKAKSDNVHVVLSTTDLDADEKRRDELVGAVMKMGPVSALALADPTILANITNVGKTYTVYKSAVQTAAASGQQHDADVAAAGQARVLSNKSLRLLATQLETSATTEQQITDTGFQAYTGKPLAPPLVAPVLGVKYGKKGSGKATVFAQETGGRRAYIAESSPNPVTTWSTLVGDGKTRKLTGAPGTSLWVRFALRQGQSSSDWSTAVLVTFI